LLSVLVITMLGAAILYLVDIIKHYEIKRVD
jgi:hypothetical protein